jgi:hypothetical protein
MGKNGQTRGEIKGRDWNRGRQSGTAERWAGWSHKLFLFALPTSALLSRLAKAPVNLNAMAYSCAYVCSEGLGESLCFICRQQGLLLQNLHVRLGGEGNGDATLSVTNRPERVEAIITHPKEIPPLHNRIRYGWGE